jgi:hypothetical protein
MHAAGRLKGAAVGVSLVTLPATMGSSAPAQATKQRALSVAAGTQ